MSYGQAPQGEIIEHLIMVIITITTSEGAAVAQLNRFS